MTQPTFKVTIRTPRETIADEEFTSIRILTKTGHVGLRPGGEPTVMDVKAGLVLLRSASGIRYAGTAGGLLHTSRQSATLLTPLAVMGDDVESVSSQLDVLLSEPSEEMEARRTLGRLETRILHELSHGDEPRDAARATP